MSDNATLVDWGKVELGRDLLKAAARIAELEAEVARLTAANAAWEEQYWEAQGLSARESNEDNEL